MALIIASDAGTIYIFHFHLTFFKPQLVVIRVHEKRGPLMTNENVKWVMKNASSPFSSTDLVGNSHACLTMSYRTRVAIAKHFLGR